MTGHRSTNNSLFISKTIAHFPCWLWELVEHQRATCYQKHNPIRNKWCFHVIYSSRPFAHKERKWEKTSGMRDLNWPTITPENESIGRPHFVCWQPPCITWKITVWVNIFCFANFTFYLCIFSRKLPKAQWHFLSREIHLYVWCDCVWGHFICPNLTLIAQLRRTFFLASWLVALSDVKGHI